VRVRAVFEQQEVPRVREREDRIEVDREAVEVDDHDGARPGRDARREIVEVRAEVVEPNVDRHRHRADRHQRFDRGHERVRLDQHLVAWLDPGRACGERERVGAGCHAPDVPDAQVRRHFGLEGFQLVAAEELHSIEHPLACREQLRSAPLILARQLHEPNAPHNLRRPSQCVLRHR
jgi:hypothetical protein